jgi:hypothetical protein
MRSVERQQVGGDAGDLGLVVHDLTEGDARAGDELGPQLVRDDTHTQS